MKIYDIWIRTDKGLVMFKPTDINITKEHLDDFSEKHTLSWIENYRMFFDSKLFDKRCKSTEKIISKLIKKYL